MAPDNMSVGSVGSSNSITIDTGNAGVGTDNLGSALRGLNPDKNLGLTDKQITQLASAILDALRNSKSSKGGGTPGAGSADEGGGDPMQDLLKKLMEGKLKPEELLQLVMMMTQQMQSGQGQNQSADIQG